MSVSLRRNEIYINRNKKKLDERRTWKPSPSAIMWVFEMTAKIDPEFSVALANIQKFYASQTKDALTAKKSKK